MGELSNCSRCGVVFVKSARDICQTCFRQEEKEFDIVYTFLRKRKNREATLSEIVDATGIDQEIITKFIKQKRLRTSQFPKLSYPCEKCHQPIISGTICGACSAELKTELSIHEKTQSMSVEKTSVKEKANAYYSFNQESDK